MRFDKARVLAQMLPEVIPVKDKLTPGFLRRLLQQHPPATLAEFRDKLRIEYSTVVSTTGLKRAELDYRVCSHVEHFERQAA
jgi:hypothetical protein